MLESTRVCLQSSRVFPLLIHLFVLFFTLYTLSFFYKKHQNQIVKKLRLIRIILSLKVLNHNKYHNNTSIYIICEFFKTTKVCLITFTFYKESRCNIYYTIFYCIDMSTLSIFWNSLKIKNMNNLIIAWFTTYRL